MRPRTTIDLEKTSIKRDDKFNQNESEKIKSATMPTAVTSSPQRRGSGFQGVTMSAVASAPTTGGQEVPASSEEEEALQGLFAWIDTIPLSRPKRNLHRDFSDAGMRLLPESDYPKKRLLLHQMPHHFLQSLWRKSSIISCQSTLSSTITRRPTPLAKSSTTGTPYIVSHFFF